MYKEILALIKKDLQLEWRSGQAWSSSVLYVFTTAFVVYLTFINIPANVWNPIFWIIILFTAVNAVSGSFSSESGSLRLYYYTLVDPVKLMVSKVIYNLMLVTILSFFCFIGFAFVTGNPIRHLGDFLLVLLAAGVGLSITLTFTAAIAAGVKRKTSLLTILSFPLLIPTILVVLKLSANAIGLINDSANNQDLITLFALDLLLLGLGILLFPFLWKD
jgi:heme exporter protein B